MMLRVTALLLGAAAAGAPAAPEFDLVVVGGSGGGVACAVRAAREGLSVLLVNRSRHVGGMLSGGIGTLDTMYEGKRAPILEEFTRRVRDHYRTVYGAGSEQYRITVRGQVQSPGPRRITFEAKVAERAIDDMLAAEKRLTVLKGFSPVSVERAERTILAVVLRNHETGETRRVTGRIFADAGYEADLAALAGVPYRIGREDRNEYGEPHAGRIFSKRLIGQNAPTEAVEGKLALRPFGAFTQQIYAGSTGEGDDKVQAYHYRVTITNDPANRRLPGKPANYDREFIRRTVDPYRAIGGRLSGTQLANRKYAWFQNLTGGATDYPGADWEKRQEILRRHRDFALGAIYFFQNDASLTEEQRRAAREWGLARDEFPDNGNFPYELYVREARRIVGRKVFTELDASLARGYARTPIHGDSIAIAEWILDSHEVSAERSPGSDADGKLILGELTRPAQIPYTTLLPEGLDNLLVPVCLSATHIGWGTIRLEPTWMHIGESAGFAAALSLKSGTVPGKLPVAALQRRLVENGVMISFFNDMDMATEAEWVPAAQYLAARGYFDAYDIRAGEPLTAATAREWARTFGETAAGVGKPAERARALHRAERGGSGVTAQEFMEMLSRAAAYWNVTVRMDSAGAAPGGVLNRGQACVILYRLLQDIG
jgi:hypothetical protein